MGSLGAMFVAPGLMFVTVAGCAVVKATNQPDKKNLSVLSVGTPRRHVIAELGAPNWSGEKTEKQPICSLFGKGTARVRKSDALFSIAPLMS